MWHPAGRSRRGLASQPHLAARSRKSPARPHQTGLWRFNFGRHQLTFDDHARVGAARLRMARSPDPADGPTLRSTGEPLLAGAVP